MALDRLRVLSLEHYLVIFNIRYIRLCMCVNPGQSSWWSHQTKCIWDGRTCTDGWWESVGQITGPSAMWFELIISASTF